VNSVQFSPDRRWIASAGYKVIKIWDAENGGTRKTSTNTGDWGYVNHIDFNPDGTKLLSASHGNGIKIWSVGSDGALSFLNTLSGGLSGHGARFSPGGKYIASGVSGGMGHVVIIWNATDGVFLRTLTGHTNRINSLAFMTDNNTLASGSSGGTIKLWDVEQGSEISSGQLPSGAAVVSVEISPDGNQLATGTIGISGNGNIRIWNLQNSNLAFVREISGHGNDVYSVKFSPDGKYLASGSYD